MNINVRLNGEVFRLEDLLRNPGNAAEYARAVATLNLTGEPQVAVLCAGGKKWEIPVAPFWVDAHLG